MATKEEGFIKMWLRKKEDLLRCGYERRRIYEDVATKEEGFIKMWIRKKKDLLRCGYERRRIY